ncbi:MAG TPA: S8 family serine peptidase [Sedimentisphaerales bacterium]|nr:S8 family serine peptidase [Sedimentisphaerales bacterium]
MKSDGLFCRSFVVLVGLGLFGMTAVSSGGGQAIVCFPLDTDPGWSTEGQWAFGVPTGGGGLCKDPTSGHTGSNVYGYNLEGGYTDSMPEYHLTSTAFDCSGYRNVTLSFWRRMGIDSSSRDHAKVEVSNDGTNWTTVWEHTSGAFCDVSWLECVYDISAVADDRSSVYIRWTMGPTDAYVTFPGWNIDDICLFGEVLDLRISPAEGFTSSGYTGGPFSPSRVTYTLTNISASPISWRVHTTQPWLDVTPDMGELGPGDSNTVDVFVTAEANNLPLGDYNDAVEFEGVESGVVETRNVMLEVRRYPPEIEVSDSIEPVSDLNMPFGDLFVGLSRTERITITNSSDRTGLLVTEVSLRGRSVVTTETAELSIRTLAVTSGSEDSVSYVPAAAATIERPASKLVVGSGYRALTTSLDVLLLASGDEPVILRTGLKAFPDINSVDYFNCAFFVPTLDELVLYDVVVVMSNYSFSDPFEIGDILADYVDGGGKVVQAVASFSVGGGWELQGRFVTQEGYEPFAHGEPEFFSHTLGDFNPDHPIMAGISELTDWLPTAAGLKPGADWVADWSNGTPLAATQGEHVVGINMFVFDNGSFSGDVVLLFHNAMVWLIEGSAEGFELTGLGELPVLIPPLGHMDVNVVFEPKRIRNCSGVIIIESDDLDEPRVEVRLSGAGVPDYLQIVPDQGSEFAGHPGGPFVPTKVSCTLTNNSPAEQIDWFVTKSEPWLEVIPGGGTLAAGKSTTVLVNLNSVALTLPVGDYNDMLVFTDVTTGVNQSRAITLRVFTAPKIWVDPVEGGLSVSLRQGDIATEFVTIGNTGDADLQYRLAGRQTLFVPPPDQWPAAASAAGAEEIGVSAVSGQDSMVSVQGHFESGQLLVRFAPRSKGRWPDTAEKNAILAKVRGGSVLREYRIVRGLCSVKLPAGVLPEQALAALNGAEGILYAEPNYQLKLVSDCQNIPNDSRFSRLWGMHNTGQSGGTPDADIDAPEAWCIHTEANDVVVGVVDTGIDYNHPDLAANMWVNEAEFNGEAGVDDDGNGYVDDIYGYDFVNNDGDPMDDHYHGTHVAGTIGAVGNNGKGVAGVCWRVQLMGLKFLDSQGTGWTDDAVSCIEYSILMGANLTSNSWGGGGYSRALKDAIDAAGAAGQLFVAAAGNDALDSDTYPHYPSSYESENIISVLSTDKNDQKSGFSNYGFVSVDLGAPGSDILSCVPEGGYQSLSGTSMATPHVAGACALVWSASRLLSHLDVKDIIMNTVDRTPALEGQCVSEGRLNVYKALVAVPKWFDFVPSAGTVAAGQASDVNVVFDAGGLEVGDYYGELLISSNDAYTPLLSVPLKMTVERDVLTVLPDYIFESTGLMGGPFVPQSMTYTLTSDGNEPFDWTAVSSEPWLDIEPNSGTLNPGGSETVIVAINAEAEGFDPNTYGATVTFIHIARQVEHVRFVELVVTPLDYFTEWFDSQDNDLANDVLTFTPDGSGNFYRLCVKPADAFATDPNGGVTVSLKDDDYKEIVLGPEASVCFYGQDYNSFYIGSNGYITFETGDTQYAESLENHFLFKRISALFDDLSPNAAGARVSWKQLGDRVAVTFENVPEYGVQSTNNFQVEMFSDGVLRITYLNVAAFDGLVGLSGGNGVPAYFIETNLSEHNFWYDLDDDCDVDFLDFNMLGSYWGSLDCSGQNNWCEGADFEPDGDVDWNDLAELAGEWLQGTSP